MPRVAIGLAIAFTLVIVVFHVLRPDVEPLARGVSRYAVGRYGEMFNAVSLVLAFAFVVTGCAFRQAAPGSGALGVYLLWLGAAGMVFVAAFPLRAADSMATENPPHQIGGMLFFVTAAAAPVLLSRAVGRHSALAWAVVAATAVFFLSVGVPALVGIRGLLQRVCFATIVAWLIVANVALDRLGMSGSGCARGSIPNFTSPNAQLTPNHQRPTTSKTPKTAKGHGWES